MADSWASSAAVRAVMRANKSRDTRPELAVRRLVHAAGLRYRVDTRPLPGHRFRADLVFTRARIAVFIDGCYWHGCADHYRPATAHAEFWRTKVRDNQERDRRTDEALVHAGWTVMRAWEHEPAAEVARRVIDQYKRNALASSGSATD